MCFSVVRVQFDSPLIFSLSPRPVPGLLFIISQRLMGFRETLIQPQRFYSCRFRFVCGLFRVDAVVAENTVCTSQIGIGRRVVRINGYRLIKILDGFLSVLRPPLFQ